MKANELRIGNLINYSEDGSLCSVLAIDGLGLSVNVIKTQEITWVELDQFEPILLTPEILEKCGFEKEMDIYKIVTKNLDYCFRISFTGSGYFSQNAIANHPIKYLHQLQNLYFSLTGTELEYKP